MKTVYRYYTPYRPPMPGAVPRDGLDRVVCYDERMAIGNSIYAYGYAEYFRPLTDQEISDYELATSPNNPLIYS